MSGIAYVGMAEGHYDPAVAVVRDGEVVAFAEEERFIRFKHAYRIYPSRALRFCLNQAGVRPEEIGGMCINWNVEAYSNGEMAAFYERLGHGFPIDDATRSWQRGMVANFSSEGMRKRHALPWRRLFGDLPLPPLRSFPHHFAHALHAYFQSPFNEALCLTIDGSGDQHCTVLWECRGTRIRPLREITIPHSLGWFYAAFTEYLGFQAYDGEYKVMGLAAYGRRDAELAAAVGRVLRPAEDGIEYRIDPSFIHHGPHTWSERFTDRLPELLGRAPRLADAPVEDWHCNLAFAAQAALEQAVERLAVWGLEASGTSNLCVGGGVGLNVKMNSRLFKLPGVDAVFAQPLCSDGGAAAGAALAAYVHDTGVRPLPLRSLALGNEQSDEEIQRVFRQCGVPFARPVDLAEATAKELAAGAIVGWFQGRMEAGPRALGQRSVLADPRSIEARDRINQVIKYREKWRPFCPSIAAETAGKYFERYCDAPFMCIAFDATDALKKDAPAIVHVDGTARVQIVHQEDHPLFHRLIAAFARETGVPVLLNTSFNVKGEPIVHDIHDAIRMFFSTAMDVLVAGPFMVHKNRL